MNNKLALVFETKENLLDSFPTLEELNSSILNIYSPIPINLFQFSDNKFRITNNEKRTMNDRKLSLFALIGAIIGLLIAFWLQYSIHTVDYKLNLGGKSFFYLAYAVPVMFELSILFAVIFAFISFLIITRLPKWYSDIEGMDGLHEEALKDKFVIIIEVKDNFDEETIRNKIKNCKFVELNN